MTKVIRFLCIKGSREFILSGPFIHKNQAKPGLPSLQGPSRQGQGMCKRSAQIPGGWGMSERSDEIPVSMIGSFLRCRQKTGRNFGVAVQKLLIFCFSSCCRKENDYFFCDSGLQIPVRETCLVQIVRYSARIAVLVESGYCCYTRYLNFN